MDFTISIYKKFLKSLISKEYSFFTFNEFIQSKHQSFDLSKILLRHDVDLLPMNSLKTAIIENSFGIKGSYYFRIVPKSYNIGIIEEIASLGHEIGYHYEDVDLIRKKIKVKSIKDEELLIDLAYENFCKNLEKMIKIADIKTICAHGSPLSPYDNKIIWRKYDYKDLGIIGEPYFDINWNVFAYLTDTGRKWNGDYVNVRDKVNSKYNFNFKSTDDILRNNDKLPNHVMITLHPQRWNDNFFMWTKELLMQSGKNSIKRYFLFKI